MSGCSCGGAMTVGGEAASWPSFWRSKRSSVWIRRSYSPRIFSISCQRRFCMSVVRRSSSLVKSSCCWRTGFAEILLDQAGSQVECRLKLGHGAQKMDLARRPPLFDACAPLVGVFRDPAHSPHFVMLRGQRQTSSPRERATLITRRFVCSRSRSSKSSELFEDPGGGLSGPLRCGQIRQRLERRLDAGHGGAIEFHLFAHVPVQRAGDQPLQALDDRILEPRRRGFTVPMAATLASAASRACTSGIRSAAVTPSNPREPCGFRARTRSRISWIAAVSSSSSHVVFVRLHCAVMRVETPPRGVNSPITVADTGLRPFDDIAQKAIHHVLLEDAQIAVRQHVHLERLQFQTQLVRHVAQRQCCRDPAGRSWDRPR